MDKSKDSVISSVMCHCENPLEPTMTADVPAENGN
jgi:hypothetical protein